MRATASDGAANATSMAGTVLDDRYRLIDRIAGGGMGDVWRAVDEVLGRTVAIKVLRPEYADDKVFRERLRREARAAGAISDARVMPVVDFGEVERENAPPLSYLVMESIDGVSLSAKVSTMGPLGAERTILILEQTASALQAAHDAGVIHRDIKPGNIMVTPQGELKIVDFGIAHASDALSLNRTGTTTGTAKYLSPEQAGGQSATAASDLYSLGVVAYACLTGEVPFHEGNEVAIALAHVQHEPPGLPTDVPAGLRRLIMWMLEKDPSDRPANAAAVAAAAGSLRHGGTLDLEGQHPFPAAMPAMDTHPRGGDDPDETAAVASAIAVRAAVPSNPRATQADVAAGARIEEAFASTGRRNVRRGAIAIVVLLVVAAAFIWWSSGGIQVPDVVVKPRAETEAIMVRAGLLTKFVTADVPHRKSGIVVKQSQPATSKVDKGSTIALTVASGKVDLPTDALVALTYNRAAAMLKSLGLKDANGRRSRRATGLRDRRRPEKTGQRRERGDAHPRGGIGADRDQTNQHRSWQHRRRKGQPEPDSVALDPPNRGTLDHPNGDAFAEPEWVGLDQPNTDWPDPTSGGTVVG